jgi:hypothetical protein
VRKYFNGSTIDRIETITVKQKKVLTDEQRAEFARKRRKFDFLKESSPIGT